MKLGLLLVASIATSPAYAGAIGFIPVPALDEFGLITLSLVVGLAGARALQHFRGRGKKKD
jgi:hypothetical protein